jgi:hypothetical protein
MKLATILSLVLAGCAAQPVNMFTTIPKETASECTKICDSIGLQMTSVVVVASQVGCVCEKSAASKGAQASTAGAGAVIALEAQRQQQQRQQQQIHAPSQALPPPALPPPAH